MGIRVINQPERAGSDHGNIAKPRPTKQHPRHPFTNLNRYLRFAPSHRQPVHLHTTLHRRCPLWCGVA